jgi:hypothetical protein
MSLISGDVRLTDAKEAMGELASKLVDGDIEEIVAAATRAVGAWGMLDDHLCRGGTVPSDWAGCIL